MEFLKDINSFFGGGGVGGWEWNEMCNKRNNKKNERESMLRLKNIRCDTH